MSGIIIYQILMRKLTLQNPAFVLIRAKYILLCVVSAEGPDSRIKTYGLPFPPTDSTSPSYLTKDFIFFYIT